MIFVLIFWAAIIYLIVRMTWLRKKKYYRWLARQIPDWEQKQLISPQQAENILAHYRLTRAAQKKFDMAKLLLVVGSLFIGVGAIFFIASNWPRIPDYSKTVILLGVTISTLCLGYYLSFQTQGHISAGKALLLLAALFWGASVILIAQIYNVPVDQNGAILLLWAFPILPIALSYKNEYVHLLASLLFLVWNFLYSASSGAPNYYYPLIALGLLLPTARPLSASHYLTIAGLVGASIYCAFCSFEWLALCISLGLLAYFLRARGMRAYLYAATLSFASWEVTCFIVRSTQPNLFFFLPLGALFYCTYKERAAENLIILLVSVFIWCHLTFYSLSVRNGYEAGFAGHLLLALCLGVAVYGVGIAQDKRRIDFAPLYKLFGYLVTVIALYLLSFGAVIAGAARQINPALAGVFLAVVAVALYGAIESKKRGYFADKAFAFEQYAIMAVLGALACVFACRQAGLLIAAVNAALVACALLTIAVGAARRNPFICNMGVGFFALYIITRYIDVGWQLKERSLFFVAGGIVIMCAGMYLEKNRREMLKRMK